MESSRLNIVAYLWKERFLPVILLNGIAYAIATLISPIPEMVYPVSLFLGFINTSVINSVPSKNLFVRMLKTILATFLGSLLGMLFLLGACLSLSDAVVCSPNNLRATIFAIFAFVQIMVIGISIETLLSKKFKSS